MGSPLLYIYQEIVAKKAVACYYRVQGGENMIEQKKSITMKDVALEAGVSVGTVSRVINKEKGIKEVTLQKVEQAIKTLNYIPDYYARGMKKNRTETIALILPSVWHPFFSEFAMHVENEVYKRNNKLLL